MSAEVQGWCTTLTELKFLGGGPNTIYFDLKKVLSDDIDIENSKKVGK